VPLSKSSADTVVVKENIMLKSQLQVAAHAAAQHNQQPQLQLFQQRRVTFCDANVHDFASSACFLLLMRVFPQDVQQAHARDIKSLVDLMQV
jgi:hypothetical protein